MRRTESAVDEPEFARLMARLRGHYPQRISPDEWEVVLECYYDALSGFGAPVLVYAFNDAYTAHRQFFPTAGELDELCVKHKRAIAARAPRLTEPEQTSREAELANEIRAACCRGDFAEAQRIAQREINEGRAEWSPGYDAAPERRLCNESE